MSVRILAVGDVCGEPGLDFLEKKLKAYRRDNNIDFVVVNGENANVVGVTPRQADMMFRAGADVITLGNHTWTRTELRPYLDERRKILRPANFGPQCPGRGIAAYKTPFGDVCVLNLMGRFTLDSNTDNPFVIAEGYMAEIKEKIILVDFHAEGTSEKRAMGFMLDGPGQRRLGDAHACANFRRLRAAQRHRLYYRPGHDRPGKLCSGYRAGAEHRQIHGDPPGAMSPPGGR